MGNGEKLAPRSGHGRYTLRCARITALEDHVSLGMLPPAKQVRPHDPREVHSHPSGENLLMSPRTKASSAMSRRAGKRPCQKSRASTRDTIFTSWPRFLRASVKLAIIMPSPDG